MSRIKLRNGGKPRHKALFGIGEGIMAAATMAAAGINAAATASAAKQQAKAMEDNAKLQAETIEAQTANSNALQKEQLAFTRSQNQENRQQQQDIQATLQMMAGQSNMNDRMERNKMQVRLGGRPRRMAISSPFYGGAQFQVTDGGGVIPISISPDGYGLYELFGNDHEHYHKTPSGKNKTGVGIKFNNGSIVEGEGNQNTNQGELLYVTPTDAMFISKHSIGGFNPAQAVMQGANPEQVFAVQENLKAQKGLNDDGSKSNRKSLKHTLGGLPYYNEQANMTQNPNNGTAPVAGGMIYGLTSSASTPVEEMQYTTPIAKRGCRVSLKCGGRKKAEDGAYIFNYDRPRSYWNDYGGATLNAAGNLLGAGFTTWGNLWAGNRLGKAYNKAGNILADAYSQMHGIDMNELKMEDYAAPHSLAVIRDANTNVNPQLERIRRNAVSERREINRGTLSSAARQQRLAATNDRAFQRMGEQYAYKDNADEQIKQGNAQRITETAQANADRDVQARKDYTAQRMSLLQYNNNIENAKLAGIGQARADAITQAAMANAQGLQTSLAAIGSGIAASGQGFGAAYDAARTERTNFTNTYIGLGNEDKVQAAMLRYRQTGDSSFIEGLLASNTISNEDRARLTALLYGYNNPTAASTPGSSNGTVYSNGNLIFDSKGNILSNNTNYI